LVRRPAAASVEGEVVEDRRHRILIILTPTPSPAWGCRRHASSICPSDPKELATLSNDLVCRNWRKGASPLRNSLDAGGLWCRRMRQFAIDCSVTPALRARVAVGRSPAAKWPGGSRFRRTRDGSKMNTHEGVHRGSVSRVDATGPTTRRGGWALPLSDRNTERWAMVVHGRSATSTGVDLSSARHAAMGRFLPLAHGLRIHAGPVAPSVRLVPVCTHADLGQQRHLQLCHTAHQRRRALAHDLELGLRHFEHQLVVHLHHELRA